MPLNGEALRIEFVEDLVDGAPFVRVSLRALAVDGKETVALILTGTLEAPAWWTRRRRRGCYIHERGLGDPRARHAQFLLVAAVGLDRR